MTSNVNIIPATKRHVQNGDQFRRHSALRVAAYCRVSTDEESQENSYAVQQAHYTSLILSRPGWELAGIYADEGKSGTTRKGRIHFNELIADCKAGKVDYIITKSISRFARNTADALECVHELQRLRPPVGIYFERENIDTLNANSEMFLTFYCSMAQEESHSISENIKWSIQKNFRAGKPQINLGKMLGYDMAQDGQWVIREDQAEIVRYIYQRFLSGVSANAIARELNERGKTTVNGKMWRADAIFYVLRNEKYVGDIIMQKTYTESFLTHKAVRNTGEYPQYYKENHHPAIIDREVWNRVQELLAGKQSRKAQKVRSVDTDRGEIVVSLEKPLENSVEALVKTGDSKGRRGRHASPFAMLSCGYCGCVMRRMSYNSTIRGYSDERVHKKESISEEEQDFVDSYTFSYGVWICKNKSKTADAFCPSTTLTEASMEQSFMEMLYRIKRDVQCNGETSEIWKTFRSVYDSLRRKEIGNGFVVQKLKLLEMEIAELEKQYEKIIQRVRNAGYAAEISFGTHMTETAGIEPATEKMIKLLYEFKMRMDEKVHERTVLLGERGVAEVMKQNFEAFLKDLKLLSEKNDANMPLNVNTIDTDGSIFRDCAGKRKSWYKTRYNQGKLEVTQELIKKCPDYLTLNEYMIRNYIIEMKAFGDEIRYTTTFGLTLTGIGNSRSINAYEGYRLCDGKEVKLVTDSYMINRGKIQHHWRKKAKFD